MKLTKPIKKLARDIVPGVYIKVGGHLFHVDNIRPGYCDFNKVSYQLTDPDDPRGPITSVIIPGHIKLKVYTKK